MEVPAALAEQTPPRPRNLFTTLYFQVIVAIILGGLLGYFAPLWGEQMKWLGDLFIKLVKMIIAPVIFLTVASGIAGLKEISAVGRVAGKAFAYFLFFSTLALIVGLIVGNVIQPGAGMHIDPKTLDPKAVDTYTHSAHELTIIGFISSIVPNTMVSSLTDGSILQVLFVAILFGVSLSMIGPVGQPVLDLVERLTLVIYKIVGILMRAAPIGAFGAIAFTIGKYGIASLINLGMLIGTFYITALIFVLVILGAVGVAAGFSIFKLIKYLGPELLLVLGTSSSEAALPKLIEKMERAGCERSVVGLVVPTGYSFNLDGTNIYMTLAALFIAQACDVHLPLEQQIGLLLIAMLSSKGAAGVTGAGFITLAATLSIVPAVPVAGMALILGVDRFMSECRSLTNFIGNAVATIVVARWEKALDREKLKAALG
jgi:aerobic C4-dicarboxylate transport protein